MNKIKNLFNNRFFWIVAGVFLLVALASLTIYLIYTKDQPKFIPEKVREDIRGSIKEEIAKPLSKSAPAVGSPLVKAAYVTPDETAGWTVYKEPVWGLSLKYPSDLYVYRLNNTLYVGDQNKIDGINDRSTGLIEDVVTVTGLFGNNLTGLVEGSFDAEGVQKIEKVVDGRPAFFIKDEGPNRFGGGTGYYYYILTDKGIIELGLDYFGEKEYESENIKLLQQIFETLTI